MKKTLALLLALALVFSSLTVAFAEETISADAKAVSGLGMLVGSGDGVTSAYLTTTPNRIQAAIMVLRLKGLEEAAKAFTGVDNFADAKDAAWAAPIMAYLKAHPEVGFGGIGNDKFNPNGLMDVKSYYKVMLETLGYKQNTTDVIGDFTYPNVLDFAAKQGLTKVATATNFTVDNLATATVETLKAKVKGSEKTLAASLVEAKVITAEKAIAAGVFTPAAVNFEVKSVTANNLKAVKVELTKEVDKNSLTTSTVKLSIDGTTTSLVVDSTVILSADKKVIYILANNAAGKFTQSADLKVTIDGLKSTTGDKITAYTNTLNAVDTTMPAIESLTALNAKQLEVFFSEPVAITDSSVYNAFSNIKIDGDVMVATVTPDYTKNSIVFGLGTALKAGSHKIALTDVYDYANFKAVDKEFTFTLGDDVTPPEVVSAKALNVNSVEVTFNEAIENIGTIKVDGQTIVSPAAVLGSNNTKFRLDLPSGYSLNLSAIVQVKIAYVNQTDVVGNKVATEKTFTFQVADDTALPTVTAVVGDGNKLTLTFSKTMTISTVPPATAGTITIEDKDETVRTITINGSTPSVSPSGSAVWSENNTVLTITNALNGLNPQDVKVVVKDMKDATIRANLLPETTLTLKVNDSKIPTAYTYYKATSGVANGLTTSDDTITFFFSEAMDLDTLKNLSNYVDSTPNTLAARGGSVKSVAADNKSITIKVPGIYALAFPTAPATPISFTIYAIKDQAGNMMTTATGVQNVTTAPSSAVSILAAESTDGVKVKVQFSGVNIASVNPAALKLVTVATPETTYAAFTSVSSITNDGTNSFVTFTANRSLGTDPSLYAVKVLNGDLVKDVYGTSLTDPLNVGAVVADKVAPTAKVATGSALGQIKITFSEAINGGTTSVVGGSTVYTQLNQDIVVRNHNGGIVTLTTTNVTFLKGGASSSVGDFDTIVITNPTTDSGKKYTVQIVGRSVTDRAAVPNAVEDLAQTTVVVK